MKTFRLFALAAVAMLCSTTLSAQILFVTLNADNYMDRPSDLQVVNLLSEEWDVDIISEGDFTVDAMIDGEYECIYISEAISRASITAIYSAENAGEINIGMVLSEPTALHSSNAEDNALYWQTPTNGLTYRNYDSNTNATIPTAAAEHDIVKWAGLESDVDYMLIDRVDPLNEAGITAELALNWILATSVVYGEMILTSPTYYDRTNAVTVETEVCRMFAIEKGTTVDKDKVLQGRRVMSFLGDGYNQYMTEEAEALLFAAVEWAIEGNYIEGVGSDEDGIAENSVGVSYAYANNQLVVNEEAASLTLFNLAGATVETANNVTSYDCSALPVGIYLAKIATAEKVQVVKVVVD